ncbi:MAG: thioredoxin family protein [Pseudomonadales bacterium]|nr:thioredoxin family protein [Pseudomonadales bacterium]
MTPKLRKLLINTGLVLLLGTALFGRLIYMNLRAPDPLLPGFTQYDAATFAAAQQGGRLILADVYATWCPTCLAQHHALESLLAENPYPDVVKFRVDFDTDKDFLTAHRVSTQSTILMFRGRQELSRSIGLTAPDDIRRQLELTGQALDLSDLR